MNFNEPYKVELDDLRMKLRGNIKGGFSERVMNLMKSLKNPNFASISHYHTDWVRWTRRDESQYEFDEKEEMNLKNRNFRLGLVEQDELQIVTW